MEDNRLIGNTKSAIDFLGNKLKYGCMGCAIAKHDIIPPGGIIYEDSDYAIYQDPEIPIKGFIIISIKKHANSITMLSRNERVKLIDFMNMTILYLKDLKIVEEVTIVQEERSKHLHIWIFPHHLWMNEKFGKGISYLRDICNFAKENASNDDKREILDIIVKLKEKFKINE